MIIMILDFVGYNWPTCITCLATGIAMIFWYRVWIRRKGK